MVFGQLNVLEKTGLVESNAGVEKHGIDILIDIGSGKVGAINRVDAPGTSSPGDTFQDGIGAGAIITFGVQNLAAVYIDG